MDIIEETEASPAVREIRELNVGAYIVSAPAIFSALAEPGALRRTASTN